MRHFLIVAALLCALLTGCGGGGVSSGPTVLYSTDWSHAGQTGPDGLSQRVRLLKIDDTDAITPVVLPKTAATAQAKLTGFPTGNYRLRVELHANVNGTGAISGVCEETLAVVASASVNTAVGTSTTSLSVSPADATIQVPGSARYTATGIDATGKATFLPANAFTWTVDGPATVSTDGIVTPTATGSGAVTAILGALQAQATYSSSTTTPVMGKWTVIVYMNAANNLEQFSAPNIDQMERVANNPDVRFVVQWKEAEVLNNGSVFNGTKRYLVKPDTHTGLASQMVQDMGSGVDMGDKQTLRDFIAWSKANYPAQHYCVVVWNHGNGWRQMPFVQFITRGVSYDDETGNAIATTELPYALGPDKLDIVAWDASLMQMLEVAYEIRNSASFVVGSEESPPGQGFPYDLVFAPMRDNPDDTPKNLTKGFIDGMLAVPGYASQKIEESSIDTSKLPALATALDALAGELIVNGGSFNQAIINARANAQSYKPVNNRVYRDLYDLCIKLEAGAGVPASTITACQNVQSAILDAVVWEGHNTHSANSHGISIDFSSSLQFPAGATEYNSLALSVATQWNEWLAGSP